MGRSKDPTDRYTKRIVKNLARNAKVRQEVERLAREGKQPTLIFVRRTKHAEMLAKALGPDVPVVTSGSTSPEQREQLRKDINSGKVPVAVCTAVWSTGVDIPNLRSLVLAGAGEAPIGLIQTVGRATRKKANEFEIVDIVDIGDGHYERQAERRAEHLAGEGYKVVDDPAIQLLRATRQSRPKRQRRSTPGTGDYYPGRRDYGPAPSEGMPAIPDNVNVFVSICTVVFLVLVAIGMCVQQ